MEYWMTDNFTMRQEGSFEFAEEQPPSGKTRHSDAVMDASSSSKDFSTERGQELQNVRILLAEDSPDNQILFSRILQSVGAQLELAENGWAAVLLERSAFERAAEFDVIVMDIRMPIMDGYQATRLIRERGYRGPIVALTAHAVPGEEARCLSVGCTHFLTKPVERRLLIETIERAHVTKCSDAKGS